MTERNTWRSHELLNNGISLIKKVSIHSGQNQRWIELTGTPVALGINKFIPKLVQGKKTTFILNANTITNAWVNNIPPQEVCSSITQCQIRGSFKSTHLSVENIFAFFLTLYRVIKNFKARCIKQKSEGHRPASAGRFCSSDSGSHSLCLRHLTLAEGRREGGDGKRWDGSLQIVCHSSSSLIPLGQSVKTLIFGP